MSEGPDTHPTDPQAPEAAEPGGQDAAAGLPKSREALKAEILESLKVVRDPEIPVNIVDLGLIYRLDVNDDGEVDIDMTLTSMGCPVQDMIQADTELAAMRVEGVRRVNVEFVWTPPWSTDKMTDDGKKQMRMFGFNV